MLIDLTSTPHGPYSTLRRPHIDPTSTPHWPYIDPTSTTHRLYIDIDQHSTPISTQLRSKAIFLPPPHPPPPHFYSFLSITTSSFSPFFYLTSYLEDQTAGQSKAQKAKWRPNEGKKGQNQDKRDEKDYRAKFRNTFSSVYVSRGNSLDGPATPIQLGRLYPSTVSPGLLLSK